MARVILRLIISLSLAATYSKASLSCQDQNGNPVDWFIAIKPPKAAGQPDNNTYYYLTPNSLNWTQAKYTVDDTTGGLYNSIEQVYKLGSSDSAVYFLYNDEPPTKSGSSTYGHMKGLAAFEVDKNGIWVIHSVPHFPGSNEYNYPDSGHRYGQHFFCVTFPYSELSEIAHRLSIARPNTYQYNLPDWLANNNPYLYSIVKRKISPDPATSLVTQLKSLGGISLTYFSKSSEFGKDLYSDLVAPNLETSLFMEGWVNGKGTLPSSCDSTYKVYKVEKIDMMGIDWKTTEDHSKWAVSDAAYKPWVCLGDINRQSSQFYRGGGTLCFENKVVWSAFHSLVMKYEHC